MTAPVEQLGLPVGRDTGERDIVWRPTTEYIARSRLGAFMNAHGIATPQELITRAALEPEWYWDAVVRDLHLEWYKPYRQVLDLANGAEWPRWFGGGQYNYVRDAVDKQQGQGRGTDTALVWEGEDGETRTLTFSELERQVSTAAAGLIALGVKRGDRVGIYMPMLVETAVACLAISKIGAIYVPIFSGYGAAAVASRLQDCGATMLVTADGYYRAGKQVPMKQTASEAASMSPDVRHVVVVRRTGQNVVWHGERDVWWDELCAGNAVCATVPMDPEDPYMLIYTSGTTGRPKGIVHAYAGFPLKAAQELAYCFDLHAGDRLLWLSDIGWMMGPWAITGALMLGAACVLYEGAIAHPDPGRIWDIVERHRVTHLGISPTAVRMLMSHGEDWVEAHNVSSLYVLAGAGEPWKPQPWHWLFNTVGKGALPLINYSGGTEVAGGILSCNPLLPIKPCAFSAPVPGMWADVVSSDGKPVRGGVGELAIRGPWPGIARGFWEDRDRYLGSYWSSVPGTWIHGDWARVDDDGFWYILGRSDDTIKVAGKRIGPAEVEGAALAHVGVEEAAAIGVPDDMKGEALVLFVVLREGTQASDKLREEIAATVAEALGKALRPREVLFTGAIPRTRNGKSMRRVVRAVYLGEPPGDLTALEDESALTAVANAV